MSEQALLTALKKVEKEIYNRSEDYRKYVSNFKAHDIEMNADEMIAEVTKEMQAREGRDKLPSSMQKVINKEVRAMCKRFYLDLHPKRFNSGKKKYITSEIQGSPTNFSVVYATKPGESGSVFNRFKSLKQKHQKPLIAALNKNITALNKGCNKREKIDSRKGFIDIGHAEASAVGRQRAAKVQSVLFNLGGGSTSNKLVNKLLGELSTGIEMSLQKFDIGPPTDIIKVSMESKSFNRASMTKKEISDLNKNLKAVIESLGGQYWASLSGSDSSISKRQKIVTEAFLKSLRKNKKVKITSPSTKVKKSSNKPVGVSTRSKGTRSRYNDNIAGLTVAKSRVKGPAFSPIAMIAMMNKQLPQTVAKNMKSPALNFQTGRLASSARVTDITMTPKGFPSIGYTYDENYRTFEVGSAQGSIERDPRRLIDGSLREIAAQMAMTRFYTRRM